jgi:Ribbon-helix-helix protein, copG family
MEVKRTTATWSVTVPKPLAARVSRFVKREKRTRSELVSEALRQYLALWGETDVKGSGKPAHTPKDQEWIWTAPWQKKIREAFNDLREGRSKAFENVEDLLRDLHTAK